MRIILVFVVTSLLAACTAPAENVTVVAQDQTKPKVTGYAPKEAGPGEPVTISGENLIGDPLVIKLGNQQAVITGVSASAITASVPALDPGSYDLVAQIGDETLQVGKVKILEALPKLSAVSIAGAGFNAGSTLTVTIEGDTGDAELAYAWLVNGEEAAGETGNTLSGAFAKGDVVFATVTVKQGKRSRDPVKTNAVTIGNSKPAAPAVTIPTGTHFHGASLSAFAATPADRDGDAVTLAYQWFVNGASAAGETGQSLNPILAVRGASIFARVTASDGEAAAAADSNIVQITNTLPALASVALTPGSATKLTVLTGTPAGWSDPDGDVPSYTIRWLVNGSAVTGATSASTSGIFAKGDQVAVEFTPRDAYGAGTPVVSISVTIGTTPPTVASVSLGNGPFSASQSLLASAGAAADADGDAVTLAYRWFVNGVAVGGATTATLLPGSYGRGDLVYAEVTPNDGAADGAPVVSPSVVIGNSPPQLSSVSVSPLSANRDSTLTASAAGWTDLDGDAEAYTIRWLVNGAPAAGATGPSASGFFTKGDAVTAEFTPVDASASGTPVLSNAVTIGNTPPTAGIVSLGVGPFAATSTFAASVTGQGDADGDAVTFAYRWFVNGAAVNGETLSSLAPGAFKRGDVVAVEVTPHDGTANGLSATSAPVVIGNSAPTFTSAAIQPASPSSVTVLSVTTAGWNDADSDQPAYHYLWYKNGVSVPAQTGATAAGFFAAGDSISVRVTAFDAAADGAVQMSPAVTVTGSRPVVTGVTFPATVTAGVPAAVTVARSDADGDAITLSYTWYVNAREVAQTPTLPVGLFHRDDVLEVVVTPSDAGGSGAAFRAAAVTVVNALPSIASADISAPAYTATAEFRGVVTGWYDADGDETQVQFDWYEDGYYLGSGPVSPSPWWSGGNLWVVATPLDAGGNGAQQTSPAYYLEWGQPRYANFAIPAGSYFADSYVYVDFSDLRDPDYLWGDQYVCFRVNGVLDGNTCSYNSPYINGYPSGTTVQAVMWIYNYYDGNYVISNVSNVVAILNSPPVLYSASFNGTEFPAGSMLTLDFSSYDADGAPLTYVVDWYRNDSKVPGVSGPQAGGFTRGDQVYAVARAFDGTDFSADSQSTNVISIGNALPTFTSVVLDKFIYYANDTIQALATGGSDPEGTAVHYEYAWFVNDVLVNGQTASALPAGNFGKGNRVYARAYPVDFEGGVGVFKTSPTVTISNSAPQLASVSIAPAGVTWATSMTAVPAGWSDADGDAPAYIFQWFVNGYPIVGATADNFQDGSLTRGDVISVQVTPTDGVAVGLTINTTPILIANAPPIITSVTYSPGVVVADADATVTSVNAFDTDGDSVVAFDYIWHVNGTLVPGETTATLSSAYYNRGDVVSALVRASDGIDWSGYQITNGFTVANKAPSLASASIAAGTYHWADSLEAVPGAATDIDGDSVSYEYLWYVDGVSQPAATASAVSQIAKRGRSVKALVVPLDAQLRGAGVFTNAITIANTAPAVTTATIAEPVFSDSTAALANFWAQDPDGDAYTADVRWYRNGVYTGVNAATLAAPFAVGDTIAAEVRAVDSESGPWAWSPVATVANKVPTITSIQFSPNAVTYANNVWANVVASDADGNPITLKYRWLLNGGDAGYADSTTLVSAQWGGTWTVQVTPNDGFDDGPVSSASITVSPWITWIATDNPNRGSRFNLAGVSFLDTPGVVTLDGMPATLVGAWENWRMTITLPNSLSYGAHEIRVQTSAGLSNAKMITVRPVVTGISPAIGASGTVVTLTGNFGAQATNTVWIGGVQATVQSWTNNSILATVPALGDGTVSVTVRIDGADSNPLAFAVSSGVIAPALTSVSPASGYAGDTITLSGSGLGTSGTIYFGLTTASTLLSWSSTQVQFVLPQLAYPGSYPLSVRVGGQASNEIAFGLLRPEIEAIYPAEGTAGTVVSVSGQGFGAAAGTLTIGGIAVSPQGWSDTAVQFEVPAGLAGGQLGIQITNAAGRSSTGASIQLRGNDTWDLILSKGFRLQYGSYVFTGRDFLFWGGNSSVGGQEKGHNYPVRFNPTTNQWSRGSNVGAPMNRNRAYLVWTGNKMIVWSGYTPGPNTYEASGALYDPVLDQWTPMTSSPGVQYDGGVAVWTGKEMVAFGANSPYTTQRYNPATDTWSVGSETNAPYARQKLASVWTGKYVFIFSGSSAPNDGYLYDVAQDSWTTISTTGAPSRREGATAVWTGSEVIVWGGVYNSTYYNDGARYNPATNTWRSMAIEGSIAKREGHSAIWTGVEMIIYGGWNGGVVSGGARYNPSSDSWGGFSWPYSTGAAYDVQLGWTGKEMLVYGGWIFSEIGSLYDPAADAWRSVPTFTLPSNVYCAGWTGSEMLLNTSDGWFRYSPATDNFQSASGPGAHAGKSGCKYVGVGNKGYAYGGDTGGGNYSSDLSIFDSASGAWSLAPASGLGSRMSPAVAMAQNKIVVWSGYASGYRDTGAAFDLATNTWAPMATNGAPSARYFATGLPVNGSIMFAGGYGVPGVESSGGLYDPASDTWISIPDAPVNLNNKPSGSAGSKVMFWDSAAGLLAYDVVANAWAYVSSVNQPPLVTDPTVVGAGGRLFVWGGRNASYQYVNAGGMYDVASDTWYATPATGAPGGRATAAAAWTGSSVIFFGGGFPSGAIFTPRP